MKIFISNNYIQNSMRREAKIQNQMFTQQKRKEIDTRDFNKNLAINKHINAEQIQDKIKDSYNNELTARGSVPKLSDGRNDLFAEEGKILI